MKVVVIGNSRDLLDREDGGKIDACDRIVRINSFRLSDHEHQVGSRIDIVSICLSLDLVHRALVRSAALICQAKELWTPSWRGQASEADVANAARAVRRSAEDLVFCDDTGHKEVIMQLYGLGARADELVDSQETPVKTSSVFFPTTGFQTIHLAEARFLGADLYITGFGLNSAFNLGRFDTSGIGIWPGHNIPAEREYLLRGIDQGRWRKL